ncbi:MAG: hypothetical protein KKD63_01740 [Proteobacteria bacterium]|nr:hypothetical protein [Pseudomonadota bacterium]
MAIWLIRANGWKPGTITAIAQATSAVPESAGEAFADAIIEQAVVVEYFLGETNGYFTG